MSSIYNKIYAVIFLFYKKLVVSSRCMKCMLIINPMIFGVLIEIIKSCPFNLFNIFVITFFVAKDSFTIKVL